MSGIKQSIGSAKARQGRKVKVAPMTQAVRRALAASAMAFALSVGSGAMAANHAAATPRHAAMVHQAGYEAFAPVADLTTVAMLAPGDMEHVPVELHPTLISEYGAGDIVIDNADPISETDLKYDVVAISGYSTGGDVSITNQSTGYLYAGSLGGDAIGIYGYALDGSVTINNAGDVVAFSGSGIADGIFASGANVEVSNSGELYVVGATWAAGIEAQGEYSTGVENSGDIYAASAGGQAFGIYATGAEVTVGNEGDIEAQGYYATGIEVQSSGDVLVTNSGDITAGSLTYYYNPYTYTGYLYGSALANGINATSNGEGAAVGVSNSGDISAVSYFGGAGISATSGGQGGTASVTNSGNIYSSQYTKYGYGAYGIVTSADGDSSIDNSGGIEVVSAGAASGVAALSFAGDAHVTNSGDISTYSSAALYYNSVGITAFAANGDAHVENSGSVDAGAKYWASGVDARAYGDVTVSNSGSLYADGQKYAFGVYASAAGGDVMVHNEDGGEIGFYSYLGRGWGVFGYAGQGDVHVDNDGTIAGYAYGQSAGVFGIAGAGNVSVDNSGTIDVVSGGNVAVGVFARADYGTASVTNSGDITASNFGGYYTGYSAYGVFARGAYAEVANSGSITAEGYYYATGIAASSYYGTTVHNTGGSITAYALGGAIGINATSLLGDVDVDNASDIEAVGLVYGALGISASGAGDVHVGNSGDIYAASLYGSAIGVYAYSAYGDAGIDNSGNIIAYSVEGLADGIFASGANVEVSNSGELYVVGATWAAGIEAQGEYSTGVENSGDIYAASAGGQAFGIYATGAEVTVGNEGDIEAQGYYATGIEVQSSGDVLVTNSGDITAGSLTYYYNPYTYTGYLYGSALANGINATSNGEGAAVGVSNSGDISAVSYFGGAGISATSGGQGGTASVTNSGNIYSSQYTKYGYGAYGIVTSADGDSSIDNSGGIEVVSAGAASGVAALSFAGDAHVTNSGDISTYSSAALYYNSVGITAFAANGDAHVENSGSVDAGAKYWASGVDARAYGDVTVSNSGSLYADGQKYAFGVYASAAGGDVMVHNEDGGEIGFYSYLGRGWGVFGYAGQGDVHVDNDGTIAGYAYGQSAGVFGIAGAGNVSVDNSGTIDVVSGGNVAVGVFARADYGTASVTNSGDITASNFGGYYTGYSAYGVFARGAYAEVANSGSITVEGNAYATGIAATSYYGTTVHNTGGDITVSADGGLVYVAGYYGGYYALVGEAIGINANSLLGDVDVDNASNIHVSATYVDATGIYATTIGDISVTNSGDITGSSDYGMAVGIRAIDAYLYGFGNATGSVTVNNSGDISLDTPYVAFGRAVGIDAYRAYGEVSVTNSGNIDIYAGGRSYGINAGVKYGDVAVNNSGDITMLSHTDAQTGIQVSSGNFFVGGGDVSVVNSGDISVHSDYGFAAGIGAVAGSVMAPYGNSYIRNSGNLDVFGQYFAAGIQTRASEGNATVVNTGDVHVATGAYFDYYDPGSAVGIGVLTFFGGNLTIQNSGDVTVDGATHAYGLYAKSSNDGNVSITNSGDVDVTTESTIARGVFAYDFYGNITVNNTSTGHIDASGGLVAFGVHTASYDGTVTVNNAGTLHAGGASYLAAAVAFENIAGANILNNAATGVVGATGDDGTAWAVLGSDVVETINNSGRINGALSLYAGNDVFNNAASGTWDVGSTLSTDFGDGDDVVNNAGLVRFNDGAISFGGADASNRFNNTGTVRAFGENLVSMGDGVFTNSNLLDFIDGHTDDALAIEGDFAGTGRMNIDLDLAGSADQLFIDGSVAANAVQTVNVLFEGMPTTAHTSVAFARVTGTSAAGNFVGGQMIGYNEPANFLDLDLNVTSQLNAANTAADVFYVNLDVVGLNDTGALAASVASGAAGFLNSQVGTFRQRLGANPYGDAGSVMSAFVRAYTDEGDVSPDHVAANFGQGGNFAYNQSTWGREIGVNANLFGNFHAGLVLGNADSRQRLTGAGHGENRMDGMTWGAYATWYVPEGFYVDLSGRWMAADVKSISAAGTLVTRAHTRAVSLEGGYEWKLGSFTLVPQLQYTRTEVQDVRTIYGDRADFMAHGGTYSRGRLGVELNKTFTTASGLRWTPYGSINAIREFDGESTYTVADNFHGSTSLDGTSAMAELGIGVQKGGFGFSLGANWTDGGALDGFVGGQAVFRFAW